MDRRAWAALLLAGVVVGGCAKKRPPAAPAPEAVDTAALRRAREDSLRALQDAEARRRAGEEEARSRAAAEALENARAALTAPVYFDFDASSIRDDSKELLDKKVALLRANPDLRLRIEGNTDERGSEEYNLALGMRRAQAARQYITGFGIDATRLGTMSNGEDKPSDPGHGEDAWAKNRRDEFVITAGGERLTLPVGQ